MLTKKELDKSRFALVNALMINAYINMCDSDDLKVAIECIDLIRNPPLKFEELHENMWVWDNHWKLYIQIQNLNENAFQGYEYYAEFEENRFYRKEVAQ